MQTEQTAIKFSEFLGEIRKNQLTHSMEKEKENLMNFLRSLQFVKDLPNEQIIKEIFEKNLIKK